MMIEEYHFGSITIDGKTYNHDVEVRWGRRDFVSSSPFAAAREADEVLPWRRKESHVIDVDDVKRAVEQNPATIIIGRGESGVAEVSQEAEKFISGKGIKLIIDLTEQAVKTFNIINEESEEEEGKQNKIIGLFHLTC